MDYGTDDETRACKHWREVELKWVNRMLALLEDYAGKIEEATVDDYLAGDAPRRPEGN